MGLLPQSIIEALNFLGTGFLTAWIFYSFTSFPRPNQFEQIIQAFIFTLVDQSVVEIEQSGFVWVSHHLSIGTSFQSSFLVTIVNAVMVGFVFAFFVNKDYFHAFIRKLGISQETSYPSEWFGNFSKKPTFIVLHLLDERRIYGWPIEWPSDPSVGHFSLTEAAWLTEADELPLENVESILIKASDVRWVEFMKFMEKEDGRQETT